MKQPIDLRNIPVELKQGSSPLVRIKLPYQAGSSDYFVLWVDLGEEAGVAELNGVIDEDDRSHVYFHLDVTVMSGSFPTVLESYDILRGVTYSDVPNVAVQ